MTSSATTIFFYSSISSSVFCWSGMQSDILFDSNAWRCSVTASRLSDAWTLCYAFLGRWTHEYDSSIAVSYWTRMAKVASYFYLVFVCIVTSTRSTTWRSCRVALTCCRASSCVVVGTCYQHEFWILDQIEGSIIDALERESLAHLPKFMDYCSNKTLQICGRYLGKIKLDFGQIGWDHNEWDYAKNPFLACSWSFDKLWILRGRSWWWGKS